MTTLKNLVFKGGGVLGIAYAGVVKVLEEKNILQQIEKTAGTSAGALTALLLSLRYNADEVYSIVSNTNFKSFEDHKNIFGELTKYGMYRGEVLLDWVKDKIVKKGFAADATFKNLKDANCRDLHVYATDLNTQNIKEFSYNATPDVIVAEAVRASMSIPLFFDAFKFTNNNPNDHIYVDGGVLLNFPIMAFDKGKEPNEETLGLFLTNLSSHNQASDLDYDHIISYVKALFETLLNAQNVDFEVTPDELKRTAMIDSLGISATNFDITDAQKQALYQSGISSIKAFLEKQH